MKIQIASLAFLTGSLAFAGVFGNQPKHFESKDLQLSVTPQSSAMADGGPSYFAKLDGQQVQIGNDSVTAKLFKYSQDASSWMDAHKCNIGSIPVGKFSTSGTLTKGSGTDAVSGAKVAYITADLANADQIAKKLVLPSNWKSLCKK